MTRQELELNIQIYLNDIELYSAEYIESLYDQSLIYKKSNIFLGLLEYIYNKVIKQVIDKRSYNNDYDLLDYIFYTIYLPLNYRFGFTPTLYAFCSFVHISDSNIWDINRGVYRKDGSTVNFDTQQTVLKWYNTCKAATISRAIDDNSIGAIFAAKSAYGMHENDTQQTIEATKEDYSASRIASKYERINLPELPNMDE